ncbi:MAG: hypothetical protein KGZ63_01540 [Clostridiales bacterium]|jgi:DNA helicase TIP49 (TBP-interacting protein)|nr:hypothetical protein [Clostridiales bacterium]
MKDREREKQALDDMDKARGGNLASINETTNQDIVANPAPTPFEQFQTLVADLQTTARQQQLKTEQTIQQTLQQAATALGDAQKIDKITKQIQTMQQALTQQGPQNNPQFFRNMLQQLDCTIQEQQHQADMQVSQSLQQTISSMAQSQAAMFDSQAYVKLAEVLKQSDKTLQQWQSPDQNTVH